MRCSRSHNKVLFSKVPRELSQKRSCKAPSKNHIHVVSKYNFFSSFPSIMSGDNSSSSQTSQFCWYDWLIKTRARNRWDVGSKIWSWSYLIVKMFSKCLLRHELLIYKKTIHKKLWSSFGGDKQYQCHVSKQIKIRSIEIEILFLWP